MGSEETKGTGVIYMYTSPSGKQYIGQTIDEERRRREHRTRVESYAFSRAVQKYGFDSFSYIVLHRTKSDKALLDTLEEIEIKSRGTLTPNGYNLKAGGDSSTMSIETREKMSSSRRGIINPSKWRPCWCVETEERFNSVKFAAEYFGSTSSAVCSAVDNPKRTAKGFHFASSKLKAYEMKKGILGLYRGTKKVKCFETGQIFDCYRSAVEWATGDSRPGNLANIIDKPDRTAYGYHWVSADVSIHEYTIKERYWKRKKSVIRSDGIIFDSQASAARECSISDRSINRALKSGGTAGGYHWKYAD